MRRNSHSVVSSNRVLLVAWMHILLGAVAINASLCLAWMGGNVWLLLFFSAWVLASGLLMMWAHHNAMSRIEKRGVARVVAENRRSLAESQRYVDWLSWLLASIGVIAVVIAVRSFWLGNPGGAALIVGVTCLSFGPISKWALRRAIRRADESLAELGEGAESS